MAFRSSKSEATTMSLAQHLPASHVAITNTAGAKSFGKGLAEVFRGAFNSVDPAEILAAQAMGMSRLQVLGYIELPQMLRFSVPGMVNEFTSILKYSPFAYTVGIPEITKQATTLTSTTLQGVEVYLAVGILYFLIYRICLFGVQIISRRYQIPGITPA